MSIITTGINIVASVEGAIRDVQRFGQELKNTHRAAQTWANGYNQTTRQVQRSSKQLRDALNMDWSAKYQDAINKPAKDLERNLRNISAEYDRTFRRLGNKYQSMVMGSVALSMSGVGLMNVGGSTLGALKSSLDVARDFETVMTQIQFYGQKTADEMSQIQKDIFDISYRMPQTASEIGNAFLQAQKTGYDYASSKVMAEEASKISFMSMGKLDGEESLKYISQMKKFTNAYATEGERLALVQKGITDSLSVGQLTDKLTMTADVSAASIDSLWKTMQSSRSAFDNMGTDMDSMLALSAVMSDRLQPRAAGQALSSFGRGINMAEKAKAEGRGTRGEYYSQLTQAMGGGVESFRLEDGNVDMLKYIEGVATKSQEIWGDGVDRTSKLISIFGNSAIDLFHAYDNYAMSGNMSMEEMRDKIRDAEGHSTKFMDAIMNTSYGTEMKLKAVAEQFQILFGTALRPLFNDLLDGLTFVIGKVNEFMQAHPKLTKVLGYGIGIAGMLTVATGAVMLFIGGILALYASIGNVILQIARNTRVLDLLSAGYNSAGAMIKGNLLGPLRLLGASLLKLTGITFFLWMAWKNDFLKMRTTFTEWKNGITRGLEDSQRLFEIYADSSLGAWTNAVKTAQRDGTLDSWFTRMLLKAKILWAGLKEMFQQHTLYDNWDTRKEFPIVVDGILSDNTFAKLQEMGLLGFVEGIYKAYRAMKDLWNGFQVGVKDGLEILKTLLGPLLDIWNYLSAKILEIWQNFGYFEEVGKGIGTQWMQWGVRLGYIVGSVIAIRVAIWGWLTALKLAWSPIKLLINGVTKLWSGFNKLKNIGDMLKKAFNWIGSKTLGPLWRGLTTATLLTRRATSPNARRGATSTVPSMRQNQTTNARGQRVPQMTQSRNLDGSPAFDRNGRPIMQPSVTGSRALRGQRGQLVIPGRNGASSTIRGRGLLGRMTDLWQGRQYVPEQRTASNGRAYQQIRTRRGGVINDFSNDGRMTRNVRTGGLRGGLSKVGSFFRKYLGNERGSVGGGGATAGRVGASAGRGFSIGNLFKGAGKGMGKVAGTLGKGLLKGLGTVLTKGVPLLFRTALSAFSFIGWAMLAWEGIKLIWSNWDWIKEKAGLAWDWIKEKAGLVWEWAKSIGGLAWDWVKEKAGLAWDWVVTKATDVWNWISGIASSVWTAISGFATTVWNGISTLAIGIWTAISGFASSVWSAITGFASATWSAILGFASGVWTSITSIASGIWTRITGFASTMWNSMKTFASSAWSSVTTIASGVISTVKGFVNNIFSGLFSSAQTAWNNVKSFITNNPITQTVKTVVQKVTSTGGGSGSYGSGNGRVNNTGLYKSSRTGEWYVPKDNMPYNLHQGEMVLTRREAQILRSMVGSDNNSVAQVLLGKGSKGATLSSRIARPKTSGGQTQTAQGSSDTTIQVSFDTGAIQVANASASEMKKGAKLMFEEFKRMVELENMKHYKPARPRTR